MEISGAPKSEIERELDRRLDIVLQEGYADPARTDIPRWELVVWFAFAILIAVTTALVRKGV